MDSVLQTTTAQRVAAGARLVCARSDGRTRLLRLRQEGAARISLPAVAGGPLQAVLINTAGGLTGGDRLAWEVEVGPHGDAVVTTQACERIYRAGSSQAEVRVALRVGDNGRIAWLPQETILFDRSAFARSLDIELGAGAEALILEATLFGRLAMGEHVGRGRFSDRWRVRRQGRLVHAEAFRIGPDVEGALPGVAVAGGNAAMATLLFVSPRAGELVEAVRAIAGEAGGASFWSVGDTGKLLARLVAEDGYSLRRRLVPLVQLLNGLAGLPKLWSL